MSTRLSLLAFSAVGSSGSCDRISEGFWGADFWGMDMQYRAVRKGARL
jgi:hypothetical protein